MMAVFDSEGRDITLAAANLMDRKKVRGALASAFVAAGLDADFLRYDIERDVASTTVTTDANGITSFSTKFNENLVLAAQAEVLIDRLIEGLAGDVSK